MSTVLKHELVEREGGDCRLLIRFVTWTNDYNGATLYNEYFWYGELNLYIEMEWLNFQGLDH